MTKELEELKKEVEEMQKTPSVQEFIQCLQWQWQENEQGLIETSVHGENVLVVGSEAILRKNVSESVCDHEALKKAKGDSEQLLLECLKSNNENGIYNSYKSLAEIPENDDLFVDIKELLKDKCTEWRKQALDMIEPSLRLLLSSKCYRLVITTSFNPILEFALQKIWGDDLVIKNIHDNDRSKADIKTEENEKKGEFYDINPTLYYAFGKAEAYKHDAKFAINDDWKIKTIDCWLDIRKPNNLIQYISEKNIIAVGCKFENWVFRFFWYLLSKKPNMTPNFDYDTPYKSGSVAIMLSETDDEKRTNKFLRRNKKINYYDDSRAFMSLLSLGLLKEHGPIGGDIFISYASEDFDTANIIFNYLRRNGKTVWFDTRLRAGDLYEEKINAGIGECKIFLPILSNQTIKDLKSNEPRFYRKEWDEANKRMQKGKKKFATIPVGIEGYRFGDKEYHNEKFIPECIHKASSFFLIKEHGLADLLDEIDAKIKEVEEPNRN